MDDNIHFAISSSSIVLILRQSFIYLSCIVGLDRFKHEIKEKPSLVAATAISPTTMPKPELFTNNKGPLMYVKVVSTRLTRTMVLFLPSMHEA